MSKEVGRRSFRHMLVHMSVKLCFWRVRHCQSPASQIEREHGPSSLQPSRSLRRQCPQDALTMQSTTTLTSNQAVDSARPGKMRPFFNSILAKTNSVKIDAETLGCLVS